MSFIDFLSFFRFSSANFSPNMESIRRGTQFSSFSSCLPHHLLIVLDQWIALNNVDKYGTTLFAGGLGFLFFFLFLNTYLFFIFTFQWVIYLAFPDSDRH